MMKTKTWGPPALAVCAMLCIAASSLAASGVIVLGIIELPDPIGVAVTLQNTSQKPASGIVEVSADDGAGGTVTASAPYALAAGATSTIQFADPLRTITDDINPMGRLRYFVRLTEDPDPIGTK